MSPRCSFLSHFHYLFFLPGLFLSKKKEKAKPRFSPDLSGLCGALSWMVVVEDCNVANNNSGSSGSGGQQNGGSHYLSLGSHQQPQQGRAFFRWQLVKKLVV